MQKKIVFMGTPEFSVLTLEILAKSNYRLECVYTQPPRKSFRGQKINLSPVHKAANRLKIKVRHPNKLDLEELKFFKKIKPDFVIVAAYGQIIPEKFLKIEDAKFINIHASLLPKWRGAAPIQRSIINMDRETGISIMRIVPKLDAGPFMRQVKVKIDNNTTAVNLENSLSKLGSEIIIECLDLIRNNKARFIEQNNSLASYAKKIKKKEGKIDWKDSAKKIVAKINALNPFPGTWFDYDGDRYKVLKAEINNNSGKPGELLDEELIVGCSEQAIKILEIQKEGKNKMSSKKFLVGSSFKKGSIFQ